MNIFKFDFLRKRKSLLYWCIGTAAMVTFYLAIFPSMQGDAMQDMLSTKIDALPKSMLDAFNISTATDFTSITEYIAYCLQYVALITGAYGALLGVNTVISEEGEGTIEFLYSKPVSRVQILWSKTFAALATLISFIFITYIATLISAIAVKPDDKTVMDIINAMNPMFVGLILLGLVFLSIGILLSTLLKKDKGATSLAIGIFFTTYVIGIAAKISENIKGLLYLSPYDWFLPSTILRDGFEGKYIAISIVVIIAALGCANLLYKKKDLYIQ